MIRISLLLLTFFFSLASLFSAETVIQGKINGFDNKKIKIGIYRNYISYDEEWIAESNISEGAFKISFPLENTTQIILKIEDKKTSLFAESGKVYNIKLSYDEEANRGQAFNKFLDLNFPFPVSGETNQLIKKFNKDYRQFFAENYKKLAIKGATKPTNEFIKKWKTNEQIKANSFVFDYVSYSIAILEDVRGISEEKLYNEYLASSPILYRQKEYMNFFKQFYAEDFNQLTIRKEGKEVLKAILLENDYKAALSEIIKVKQISKPELAELYLLYGFFDVYHKKILKKETIIAMLKQAKEKGLSEENRNIAGNIAEVLEKQNRSKNAIAFNLKNTMGKAQSLESFKGKPIYLNFWSNTSIPSLRELKVMQKLEEKYGDKIHFVSINVDDNAAINSGIKQKNKYAWNFLHFGGDYELIESYQVTTIPTYFLIDENGAYIKAFAEGPVEIEKTLYNLVK